MAKPYDYDDDTDDYNDHKNDCYTAAGAAPSASVPCSLFLAFGPGHLVPALWSWPGLLNCWRQGEGSRGSPSQAIEPRGSPS